MERGKNYIKTFNPGYLLTINRDSLVMYNEVIVYRVMMYANPFLIVLAMNYTESTYCIAVYYKEVLAKPGNRNKGKGNSAGLA